MIKYFREFFNITLVRIYLIFQLVCRIALVSYAFLNQQIKLINLPAIFSIGIINDLISVCYFLPPFLLFSNLVSRFRVAPKIYYNLVCSGYFLVCLVLIFNTIAEIIFWDEFGTKFNFIAVDYLIYTHEIIGTLKESIPFYESICAVIIAALITVFLLRNYLRKQILQLDRKRNWFYAITSLVIFIIAHLFYSPEKLTLNHNRYAAELGKNGPYEFFTAFFQNALDYKKFYPTIKDEEALQIVRAGILQENQRFINNSDLSRITKDSNKTKRYNIVVITVESLSAEFLGKFGNKDSITPNLDKLAEESLFFTNLYAVGTRTVRGLEAITLSVPPTPGSSIIRRPDNQNLFSIGSVLKDHGYELIFAYGGYSYFDNLENFFQGNHFKIVDRSNLKSNEISFANIWGVADEDILLKSLESADLAHKNKKPFFSLIMTTSNHRPYTFPGDRIDLPSGGGRRAAVKYTDYAIGKFLQEAKKHSWFDDTIFVITADHCAASAGKTHLPVSKYHIPMLIYAPKIITPKTIDNLSSQIDIPPTILGMIGIEYKTKFFGHDILTSPANRAFIGTYQLLGYMKDQHLVILSPKQQPEVFKLVGEEKRQTKYRQDLVNEAISYYQLAAEFYEDGKMKEIFSE